MAKKKAKNRPERFQPRNPFAVDPLMKKGGVHEKTFKAKRKSDKTLLRKQLAEHSFLNLSIPLKAFLSLFLQSLQSR